MVLLAAAIFLSAVSFAQAPDYVTFTDASSLPLYGKAVPVTSALYERLPASYEKICRKSLWYLGRNSAGLYVRFRTDSPSIWIRWESSFGCVMNHMTPTGIRGLDLYVLYEGKWRFAGSARPSEDLKTEAKVIDGMDREERESSAEKPVVMYGTSILQGGCANRPGMAHTNILSRMLDREVINLGFSGNALLDYEIAELMASVEDPGLFVLDYVPNATAEQIRDKGERFFRILRDAHPQVPVIFIEDPEFPHTILDKGIRNAVSVKNDALSELFRQLKKSGEKNIYYIDSEGMIGDDGEATVDNIHFTDLGMQRYAEHVYPVIRKVL